MRSLYWNAGMICSLLLAANYLLTIDNTVVGALIVSVAWWGSVVWLMGIILYSLYRSIAAVINGLYCLHHHHPKRMYTVFQMVVFALVVTAITLSGVALVNYHPITGMIAGALDTCLLLWFLWWLVATPIEERKEVDS